MGQRPTIREKSTPGPTPGHPSAVAYMPLQNSRPSHAEAPEYDVETGQDRRDWECGNLPEYD